MRKSISPGKGGNQSDQNENRNAGTDEEKNTEVNSVVFIFVPTSRNDFFSSFCVIYFCRYLKRLPTVNAYLGVCPREQETIENLADVSS